MIKIQFFDKILLVDLRTFFNLNLNAIKQQLK